MAVYVRCERTLCFGAFTVPEAGENAACGGELQTIRTDRAATITARARRPNNSSGPFGNGAARALDVRGDDVNMVPEPARFAREVVHVLADAAEVRIIELGDNGNAQGPCPGPAAADQRRSGKRRPDGGGDATTPRVQHVRPRGARWERGKGSRTRSRAPSDGRARRNAARRHALRRSRS